MKIVLVSAVALIDVDGRVLLAQRPVLIGIDRAPNRAVASSKQEFAEAHIKETWVD